MPTKYIILVCSIVIITIVVVVYLLIKIYKPRFSSIMTMGSIPLNIANQGYNIPVVATATGLKTSSNKKIGLTKIVALSHNNLYPSLVLFLDHLEYRVILKVKKNYDEIVMVDVFETVKTEDVILSFKNSDITLIANLYKKENLIKLLRFFEAKKINLSEEAQKLIKNQAMMGR